MASTSAPRLLGVLQRMGSSDQGSNSLKAAAVAVLLRPLGVTITEARYFLGRALTPDSPAVSGLRSATPPRLWRSVGFFLSTAEGERGGSPNKAGNFSFSTI